MSSVWIVTSESGSYSMYTSAIEGVFASYERAVAYVESQRVTAYHHIGMMTNYDGWTKPVDKWSTSKELGMDYSYESADTHIDVTTELVPTRDKGTTFTYRYPNGKKLSEWANTYIINEWDVIE